MQILVFQNKIIDLVLHRKTYVVNRHEIRVTINNTSRDLIR